MPSANSESIEDVLRPRECAGCGYSLEHLPGGRVCPECGREYDSDCVVLDLIESGRGRQGRGRRWWWYAGEALVFAACMTLAVWFTERPILETPFILGLMAAYAATVAARAYAGLFSWRESRMQLWVTPAGMGVGPSTVEGWVVRWVQANSGCWQFVALFAVGLGARFDPPWVRWVLIAFATLGLAWWWRKGRAAWREFQAAGGRPPLVPWETMGDWGVGAIGGGETRVWCRVVKRDGRMLGATAVPIDVGVSGDEAFATALRARMEEWWAARRAGDGA